MLNELVQLGLSTDEARVYTALLELGGGFVSQIAKKAQKQRATCYHTLGNLVQRGLASKLEKGKYLFYSPESPKKLVQLAKSRLDTANNILPELLSIQNTLSRKPKIKFYEGLAGVEAIFDETLTAETEIPGFTNLSLVLKLFPDYFRRYTRERVLRKIKTRYLSPQPQHSIEEVHKFLPSDSDPNLLEILFINPAEFPFQNEVAIYQSKVAIMSLSKDEMIAILIESRTFSETMKAIFDLTWLGATSFIAR